MLPEPTNKFSYYYSILVLLKTKAAHCGTDYIAFTANVSYENGSFSLKVVFSTKLIHSILEGYLYQIHARSLNPLCMTVANSKQVLNSSTANTFTLFTTIAYTKVHKLTVKI